MHESASSHIVNRLKARCLQLIAENEELGAQLSEGRIEQAERGLVAERKVSASLRRLVDGPSRAPQPLPLRARPRV